MRRLLLASTALGLAGFAQAQTTVTAQRADLPNFSGTFNAASGEFLPGVGSAEGGSCGLGRVYNNTAIFTGSFFDIANGVMQIDEGRISNIADGGPADAYSINGFTVAYVTNVTTGVDLDFTFWNGGVACGDAAMQTGLATSLSLTGLPGSANGGLQANLIYIDLTGGLEFNLDGDVDGDFFTWGVEVVGQNSAAGDVTGLFMAGDPANCAEGAGILADTGIGCNGAGAGTGLGTLDVFNLSPAGCVFFGGYPANPFASFYMALNSDASNDDSGSAAGLGSSVGPNAASANTCCYSTSGTNCGSFAMVQDAWYSWTAPTSNDYTIDTFGSSYDTKLAIYDDLLACVGTNDDTSGLQSEVSFTATAGSVYMIQAGGFSGCGDLVLNIEETPVDPCLSIADDALEDNDSNGQASAIGNGTFAGLVAHRDDDDHFSSVVCAGDTITFEALFIDADGDLDMELTDAGGNFLDTSGSISDNEQVSFTNNTGGSVVVIAEVFLWPNQAANCGVYDLVVTGSCNIGTQYCVQNANSTGNVAQIQIGGSIMAAAGQLSLSAINMPAGETGYFVWSTASGMIDLPAAGISDGFLCLGSGKGRFNASALSTGADGSFTLDGIDTSMMPQSTLGSISIMSGDSGYFQGWFRDAAGTNGNNFTDAAVVTWQ